jgi:dihydropteroate synthase
MTRRWVACGQTIVSGDGPPRIMGVVNVTPDSFSDGGTLSSPADAVARASRLADEGADLLDVGGESSRPGADIVPLDEELQRVIPTVEAIAATVARPISVDTVKLEVARQALRAGAVILNDITGLTGDPAMIRLAADSGAGVVVMHMAGTPQTMQLSPTYHDVVVEVYDWLARRLDALTSDGIPRERIALDPGLGFGKTFEHNLRLLRNIDRFANLGCAVLVGTSRKGFLGKITGRPVDQRATASAVSSLACAVAGADVLRVHDVPPMADAIKIWTAMRGWNGNFGDSLK